MREIKFRAWDKKNKKFVKHIHINICGEKEMYSKLGFLINEFDYCEYNKCSLIPILAKDIVLMQYTGLKDKNGKEIYEGDIVNVYGVYEEEVENVGVVEYDGDGFWRVSIHENNNKIEDMMCFNLGLYEVIGNIYEDPELIK